MVCPGGGMSARRAEASGAKDNGHVLHDRLDVFGRVDAGKVYVEAV